MRAHPRSWSIPAGFTATKVLWLKRHEPENFARLHTVLLPHDYVNFRLTGRLCMECGDASGTGVLDLASRAFKPEACAAVDGRMLSVLPPLVPPDAAVGAVTEEAARRFGVPAGIPVAPGARRAASCSLPCGRSSAVRHTPRESSSPERTGRLTQTQSSLPPHADSPQAEATT